MNEDEDDFPFPVTAAYVTRTFKKKKKACDGNGKMAHFHTDAILHAVLFLSEDDITKTLCRDFPLSSSALWIAFLASLSKQNFEISH